MKCVLIDVDNTVRVAYLSEELFSKEVRELLFFDYYFDFPKADYNVYQMIIPYCNSNIYKVNKLATLFYNRNEFIYGPVLIGYYGINEKYHFCDFLGLDDIQVEEIFSILKNMESKIELLQFDNNFVMSFQQ